MKIKSLLTALILLLSINEIFSQPSPPTGLTVTVEKWNGMKYVLLKWDESSSNSLRFFVYKKIGGIDSSNSFIKLSFPVNNNFYKDRMVMLGGTYSYYVTAFERNMESQPSDTVEITLNDTSAAAFLAGTLTDEATGMNLKSGKVELIPLLGWFYKPIPVDSSGNYSAYVRPGKYFLHFMSRGYLSEFYDNTSFIINATPVELVENTSTVINAALRPVNVQPKYTLSGTVTDTAGNPLKALLTVVILNRCWFSHQLFHGITDSSGHYSVRVRGGDSVVVYAVSPNKDYMPEFYNDKRELSEADRIYITGDTSGIDFVLDKKQVYNNSLSGKITDVDGNSVMASVTLFKQRDYRHPKFKRTIMTDSLGNYSFSNIYPGSYILFTLPEYGYIPTFFRYDGQQTVKWREADSIVVAENSIIDSINVTVLPVPDSGFGDVRGTIADNNGAAINGAMIYAINGNGYASAFAFSDINGKYNINNLAPGSYTIVSDKFGYESAELSNVSLDYVQNPVQSVSLELNPLDITSVNESGEIINSYKLFQNYPNPFNPVTVINYQIHDPGFVSLKVYNIIGQEVVTLVNEVKNTGSYQVSFDGTKLNSGIYFYTLTAGNKTITKKMALIK
jgi:hypothetical protein